MAEEQRFLQVRSPCVRQCCLDDANVCLGCLRTLDEILAWGAASNEERDQILMEVARRRQARRGETDEENMDEFECIGICSPDPLSGQCLGCGRPLAAPERPDGYQMTPGGERNDT